MRLRIISGILLILALGCGRQSDTNQAPAFLPGIYVNESENEFCRIVDTFIVCKSSLEGDGYLITRRSSFQRIRKGTKGAVENQSEEWSAIYDSQGKILKGGDNGQELVYAPNENRIYNRNNGYLKIE